MPLPPNCSTVAISVTAAASRRISGPATCAVAVSRDTAPSVEPIGRKCVDYDVVVTQVPWALAQRRSVSIVAAFDAMIAAPSTTIAALRTKAALMAGWADDPEEPFEHWRMQDLVRALVDDLSRTEA